MEAAGDVRGYLLDLRNNPGGSLEQAVAICDAFLDRGKLIVTTRARVGEVERHRRAEQSRRSQRGGDRGGALRA